MLCDGGLLATNKWPNALAGLVRQQLLERPKKRATDP